MNKKLIKRLLISGFIVIVVLLSVFRIETVDQYKTQVLEQGDVEKTIDFTALWYPIGYVKMDLGSYTDIVSVNVKEGDTVTAGQLVAQLNNSNEYNQFRAAQLAYYSAINAKKQAETATTTSITIPALPGVPGSVPVTIPITIPSLTSAAQLQSAINTTYYQMLTAENNLGKRALKAPIAGKVVAVVVEDFKPGNSSASSLSSLAGLTGGSIPTTSSTATTGNYVVIASTTDNRITAAFADQDIVVIKKDMEVALTNKLTDAVLKAKVTSVSMVPMVQSTSVTDDPTYKVTMTLEKYPELPYGTKLEGNIFVERKKNTSFLPYDAVTIDNSSKGSVLVYDPKTMKTTRKQIDIGLVGNDSVEVLSGLNKDEKIVIDRASATKIIALQPWLKTLLKIQ